MRAAGNSIGEGISLRLPQRPDDYLPKRDLLSLRPHSPPFFPNSTFLVLRGATIFPGLSNLLCCVFNEVIGAAYLFTSEFTS